MKLKCNQVILSSHAQFRLCERAPKIRHSRARSRIQRRIAEEQRRGITTDWDGAVHVRVEGDLWVVLYANAYGGWIVKTVYIREIEREEVGE